MLWDKNMLDTNEPTELKPKLLGFQEDSKSRHYTNAWSPAYSPNIAVSGIRFLVKKLRSVLTQLTIEGG